MTMQANPLNALNQMYGTLQGAWEDRARTQAGRAYAGGDARGAANALADGGLVQEAADLEYRGSQREALLSAEDRAAAEERTTALLNGLKALQGVPYEQRNAVFQQLAPMLSGLMPPEIIQQLAQADKSDQNLQAFGAAIGQEAERLQLFQFPNGGDIVGVSQSTGQERSRIAGPGPDPLEQEYRRAQIEAARALASQRQTSAAVQQSRESRQSRPSGGGSSRPASGGSRPAAPSRKPWERF